MPIIPKKKLVHLLLMRISQKINQNCNLFNFIVSLAKIKHELEEKRKFLMEVEKNVNYYYFKLEIMMGQQEFKKKGRESYPFKNSSEENRLSLGEKENYSDFLNLVV